MQPIKKESASENSNVHDDWKNEKKCFTRI